MMSRGAHELTRAWYYLTSRHNHFPRPQIILDLTLAQTINAIHIENKNVY